MIIIYDRHIFIVQATGWILTCGVDLKVEVIEVNYFKEFNSVN